MPLLTMLELARQLGIHYERIHYAHKIGKLPEPPRAGITRVYGPDEAEQVRAYFAAKSEAKAEQARRRAAKAAMPKRPRGRPRKDKAG